MTIQRFVKSLNKAEGQFYREHNQTISRREIIKETDREVVFKIYGNTGDAKKGITYTILKEGEKC